MRFQTTIRCTAALALSVACAAGQEAPKSKGSPPQAEAVRKPQPVGEATLGIHDRRDNISYAMGLELARSLQRQKNNVNPELLMRAAMDALAGKPLLMTGADAAEILKKLDAEQKQDWRHAMGMISEKNKSAGETFFVENAKKQGVVTLPSGLQYKILKEGKGDKPALDDRVVCEFRSTLLDGTEFDSSAKRGHPLTLPVKGLIKGWTQALQLMPVGSKWQLYVPPQLAYGERGLPPSVGPNAMLIFDLEVVSIAKPEPTASAATPKTVSPAAAPAAPAAQNQNAAKVERVPEK
jgi:FKBP-type peptidyl-prolyl cis-trans isomerase